MFVGRMIPNCRRASAVSRLTAALVLLPAGLLAAETPAPLEQLYQEALRTYASIEDLPEYEQRAEAVVARGAEAVKFLIHRLDMQSVRVRDAVEVKTSGILVTMDLLGRMNSFARARAALARLRSHPVADVRKWADYALERTPQTQPARPALTSAPADEGPTTRRVEGNRILTAEGWFARPEAQGPKLPKEIRRAFVIPIREPIAGKTYDAIRRKAVRCRAAGAELIVFDMDTWRRGGPGAGHRPAVQDRPEGHLQGLLRSDPGRVGRGADRAGLRRDHRHPQRQAG